MRYLVFDTETSGIPKFGREHPADADYQPRVSQFSGLLISDNSNDEGKDLTHSVPGAVQIKEFTSFLKPDGWNDKAKADVDMLAEKLNNGITLERIMDEGRPAKEILDIYVDMVDTCDVMVAANVVFDLKMMRIELARAEYKEKFYDVPSFCILEASTDLCAIPPTKRMVRAGFKKFKKPSVGECYEILFGQKLENAHDAAVDTMATARILFHLINLGMGPEPVFAPGADEPDGDQGEIDV